MVCFWPDVDYSKLQCCTTRVLFGWRKIPWYLNIVRPRAISKDGKKFQIWNWCLDILGQPVITKFLRFVSNIWKLPPSIQAASSKNLPFRKFHHRLTYPSCTNGQAKILHHFFSWSHLNFLTIFLKSLAVENPTNRYWRFHLII